MSWRLLRPDRNTFFCFSPPVMIATFIIEITLAAYTVWRYKLSLLVRLALLMFAGLATFQFAEYMVCRNIGDATLWSRVGYVGITVLPPLGLHIFHVLAKVKNTPLIAAGYTTGLLFALFFLLVPSAFTGQACLGNYVIFQVAPDSGLLYAAYYYGWLVMVLVLCWKQLKIVKNKKTRRSLRGLAAGYAIFLIPATTVSLLKPETVVAMPSIMCGFAVLLAIIMGAVILPTSAEKRK